MKKRQNVTNMIKPPTLSESDLKILQLEAEIILLKKKIETMSKENVEIKSRFANLIELSVRRCP